MRYETLPRRFRESVVSGRRPTPYRIAIPIRTPSPGVSRHASPTTAGPRLQCRCLPAHQRAPPRIFPKAVVTWLRRNILAFVRNRCILDAPIAWDHPVVGHFGQEIRRNNRSRVSVCSSSRLSRTASIWLRSYAKNWRPRIGRSLLGASRARNTGNARFEDTEQSVRHKPPALSSQTGVEFARSSRLFGDIVFDALRLIFDGLAPTTLLASIVATVYVLLVTVVAIVATFGRGQRSKNAYRVLKVLTRRKPDS